MLRKNKALLSFAHIEKILELQRLSFDTFSSVNPGIVPPAGRVGFGGMLLGQSVLAALHTVPLSFVPVSLHSYFFIGCDPLETISYSVFSLREGRNYIHKEVQAFQKNKLMFKSMLMLGKVDERDLKPSSKGNGLSGIALENDSDFKGYVPALNLFKSKLDALQNAAPKLREKHIVERFFERYSIGALEYNFPKSFFDGGIYTSSLDYYVRLRPSISNDYSKCFSPTRVDSYSNKENININDPRYNYVVFSYLSDAYFLITAPHFHGKHIHSQTFSTSLDHTIHWHDTCLDCNDWLHFYVKNKNACQSGRHLMEGEILNKRSGKLVATCLQEGISIF
ncbi:hypothetical protein ACO0QE_000560 [Hanseniaspora vineae]